MKISNIKINNYKSIVDLNLCFDSYYNAICGKNDSGKSNVIKAIKSFFKSDDFFYKQTFEVIFKEHFPKWKSNNGKECIELSITLDVSC